MNRNIVENKEIDKSLATKIGFKRLVSRQEAEAIKTAVGKGLKIEKGSSVEKEADQTKKVVSRLDRLEKRVVVKVKEGEEETEVTIGGKPVGKEPGESTGEAIAGHVEEEGIDEEAKKLADLTQKIIDIRKNGMEMDSTQAYPATPLMQTPEEVYIDYAEQLIRLAKSMDDHVRMLYNSGDSEAANALEVCKGEAKELALKLIKEAQAKMKAEVAE